jgi:ParB-like chromosome segregation protein Spo0J
LGDSVSSRPEDGGPLRIWEVERLWELARDLPIKPVPLSSLTDLDRVGWYGQPRHAGHLTLREVAEHTRRIQAASFDYPIILSAEGHLLDGFHRLAKAHLLGMEEIPAVQFPENPEPDRIRPLPEWLRRTLELNL